MKYYSEEETKDLRLAFEDIVLNWARVSKKKMFGCHAIRWMRDYLLSWSLKELLSPS